MAFDIRIAESDAEILATYEVMKPLRPKIDESDYVRLVRLQQTEVGFQIALLREDGHITCVAGFRLCRSLGWGKYLYVDDLVTDAKRGLTAPAKLCLIGSYNTRGILSVANFVSIPLCGEMRLTDFICVSGWISFASISDWLSMGCLRATEMRALFVNELLDCVFRI